LEFYLETPADEIGTSLSEIKKSWQFQLLYTVSQLAAGGVDGRLPGWLGAQGGAEGSRRSRRAGSGGAEAWRCRQHP